MQYFREEGCGLDFVGGIIEAVGGGFRVYVGEVWRREVCGI